MQTVTGTLKGYDALMNLVLDDVEEVLRGKACLTPTFQNPSNSAHRRRRQYLFETSRTSSCARHITGVSQPSRRQWGNSKPLRTGWGMSLNQSGHITMDWGTNGQRCTKLWLARESFTDCRRWYIKATNDPQICRIYGTLAQKPWRDHVAMMIRVVTEERLEFQKRIVSSFIIICALSSLSLWPNHASWSRKTFTFHWRVEQYTLLVWHHRHYLLSVIYGTENSIL